ncbi:MAG: hypothetical protein AB7I98_04470 [Verrucomicrobiales bacterium]
MTGARQLDCESEDFDAKDAKLDRKLTCVVYCQDGTLSAEVAARLKIGGAGALSPQGWLGSL